MQHQADGCIPMDAWPTHQGQNHHTKAEHCDQAQQCIGRMADPAIGYFFKDRTASPLPRSPYGERANMGTSINACSAVMVGMALPPNAQGREQYQSNPPEDSTGKSRPSQKSTVDMVMKNDEQANRGKPCCKRHQVGSRIVQQSSQCTECGSHCHCCQKFAP